MAFTAVLGDVLGAAHPDRHIEAINVSGISYAMHRLAVVADEIVGYEPDILIIYSGHNEFVERAFFDQLKSRSDWQNRLEGFLLHSHLYSFLRRFLTAPDLPGRGRFQMFVRRESDVYTEGQKRKIVDEYKQGIRGIVRRAHGRGAKVMIATLPANLRQWRPQESILPGQMESEQLASWSDALRAGKEKLASAQYELAERDLQIALGLAPAYCETLYLLGQAYEGLQQWAQAGKTYQQACDCDASPVRRLSAINRAAIEVAESEEALLVDLDQVFQQQSPHGLVGFELIEDYVHPTLEGHQIIAWNLWQALERSGWLGEEAEPRRDLFEQVVRDRPSSLVELNANWFYNQGCVLFNQGRSHLAMEKFRQALEIEPHPGALANLAMLLADQGQLDEANRSLQTVLEIDPGNTAAHNSLGQVLLAQGQPGEARKHFDGALLLQPDSAEALLGLGIVLSSAGKLEQAEKHFRRALELRPNLADAHANLGATHQAQGELERAIDSLQQALRIEPDHAYAHFNLGATLRSMAKPEEAAKHLRQALELDPDMPLAHTNLGRILQDQGKVEEAIDHYKSALQLQPSDADAHYLLGRAFDSQGKTDLAIKQYREALKSDPDSAESHRSLGLALGFQNQLDEAIRHLRTALQLRPDFNRARDDLGAVLRKRERLERGRR